MRSTHEGPRGIETRADLARELSELRLRSGLTVRELARRLNVPIATIGDYFSGRHIPRPAQLELFRAILVECGVADSGELAAWLEALTRLRLTSDGRVARAAPPYRGLEAFGIEDSELFFGRDAVTDGVLERLRDMWQDPARYGRVLLVVGPSGSGKSSLLRAGVAARVRTGAFDAGGDRWSVGIITPGDDPLEALEGCLETLGEGSRLVIVDQFEEAFGVSAAARGAFFVALAQLQAPDVLVAGALRADFYEAAASEPALLPALRRAQVVLGPLTKEEVHRVIVEPARHVGVRVEDGLVDLLLADLAPRSSTGFAHDAGALPFLSYALLATWERAHRNELTVADYRAAGGLRGAVEQAGEELYKQLDPEEQELARRILCRLVKVDSSGPFTRRRVARQELDEPGEEGAPIALAVLDRFTTARLLTVDAGTVEVSHEALLTAWPRLAGWLDDDRAGLRLHHQLTDAANAWLASDKDSSLLLRGTRLQATVEWTAEPAQRGRLNHTERDFLDAGTALAEAERRTARRRTRRTQQLLGAVAVLASVAIVLAAVAFNADNNANRARDDALSRQVAIESTELRATDPALAMQLALAAYRLSPTVQARSTLLDATADEMPTRILGPSGPTGISLSRNGDILAVAESNLDTVALYSLAGGHPTLLATVPVGPSTADVFAVALSPDGRYLTAGGTAGAVTLWNLGRPAHPAKIATLHGFSSTVYALAFSPDGTQLAAADNDGSVRRWSLAGNREPPLETELTAPQRTPLHAISYSPDGRLLVAAGANGVVVVWRIASSRPPEVHHVGTRTLTSLAFNSTGSVLAVGAEDDRVHLWRVAADGGLQQLHAPLGGFTSWVDSVAFSPDGRYLVAGDSDNSLGVWDTRTWSRVATLAHPAAVTSLAFSPGGSTLISADADGSVRMWSFPPPSSYLASGSVYNINYTANGRLLAAVSGGPDGNVSLWDVASSWRPALVGTVDPPASFGPAAGVEALSPDGDLLAIGNAAAHVQLVDLSDRERPRLVGPVLTGASPYIEQMAFSPSATVLAIGDDSGRVHLWDVAQPASPRALSTLTLAGNALGVAYSPNGRQLAVSSADQKVWLWNVADPARPKLVAKLGGFTNYASTVAFTPNGHTLIAGSADATIRLWDITDPDHPRLLGVPLTGPNSYVYSIAVSPDGRTLAAGTTDQAVWLWDIANPAHPVEVADLTAAAGQVYEVNFSPNGRTLVASGTDATLHFWDYHPAQAAARICTLAGDPLTRAEWAQYVPGAAYTPPCS